MGPCRCRRPSRRPRRAFLSALLLTSLTACAAEEAPEAVETTRDSPAPTARAAVSPLAGLDLTVLAERVVANSAAIAEGDKVLVTGSSRDEALMEELALAARRAGAFPMVALSSESLDLRMLTDVPARWDAQEPELGLALAQVFDVVLAVEYGEAPELFADVPPERLARLDETGSLVAQAAQQRGNRTVSLGNEIYPTPAVARRLGVGQAELGPVFLAAMGVDPAALRARGEALQARLEAGSELHLTHPGGTDLRMQIAGRSVRVSDGSMPATGGREVWLPAGEVFLTPVPGTATGRVVAARVPYEGGWVEGLTLEVEGGRVTSLTAEAGGERLLAAWEAAGEGKDVLGVVDFGINPELRLDVDSPGTWIADGFVSVALGNNVWAGGENASAFGQYLHLGGATVTLDGETLVDAGTIAEDGVGTGAAP